MMMTKSGKVYEPVIDFWIPGNRLGLLNYLTQQYPQDTESLLQMTKDQLMAIYINVRRKRG